MNGNNVHFVIDEAASISHLECIDDAIDKYRGYQVRLIFVYQSLGQLKKCFPEGQDQTFLSNTTQIFFAVNDYATAEYVSNRLGEETIVVESGGTSSGYSTQSSAGIQAQDSTTYSSNSNDNWSQSARRLLKPEEVLALSPRTAITFTPGVPPIWTTLLRAYEEPGLGQRDGKLRMISRAIATLATASFACCLALLTAGIVTVGLIAYCRPEMLRQQHSSEVSTANPSRPDVPVDR